MTPADLPRIHASGVVDADGHILEAPDLWEKYLEPKYRDRAVRIRKDERGFEYLEVDGKPSKMTRNGAPSSLGVMDQLAGIEYKREPTGSGYVDNASFGSMDPKERVKRLDIENIDRVFLYPTLGLLWEPECEDLELALAYARAYNRWIVDFCSDSKVACCRLLTFRSVFLNSRSKNYVARPKMASKVSTPRPLFGAAKFMAIPITIASLP